MLVGNSTYTGLPPLECCHRDVAAMHELLDAAGKYDTIEIAEDVDADVLKDRLRQVADTGQPTDEFFFYFTGHGYQHESEFYFCAKNFDPGSPNITGLSTTDLHTFLRLANADVVIKVIDACHSGALLLKRADGLGRQPKEGFKSIIQIASCLNNQTSLTGDPLSLFTDQFRNAALRKKDGAIYYTDIIDALRDEFLDNHEQTPHFISQVTGREMFVDDAKRFDALRTSLRPSPSDASTSPPAPPTQPSGLELLASADARMGTKEAVKKFVDTLFDGLTNGLGRLGHSDYFDVSITEHSDYYEQSTRAFIIRCLTREERPDDFVTAEIIRERKRTMPGLGLGLSVLQMAGMWDDTEIVETYDLALNYKMERVQLKITLTPKFASLKRIAVVVSCAPSLEFCYIFEYATLHTLRDFDTYNTTGSELYRHWRKQKWNRDSTELADSILKRVSDAAQLHVKTTLDHLAKGDKA